MDINFDKYPDKLVPAIIQDDATNAVLMLGYMNQEALSKTITEGKVTFYSRTKKRLWTKGETSGNYLIVKEILTDCDNDSILIKVKPMGNTCHLGEYSCFKEKESKGFLYKLEEIIDSRIKGNDDKSYTRKLYEKGINKIAQKVGEEAVELVIEAKDNNDELFKNEAADLLYHLLVLLNKKRVKLEEIEDILLQRNQK